MADPVSVGIGVAGLVVALPGLLDVCIRYVHIVRQRWGDYKTAEKNVKQQDMAFQLILDNVEDALKFIVELEPAIKSESAKKLTDVLNVLHNDILKTAIDRLEPYISPSADKMSKWRKITFSSSRQYMFQSLEKELERWLDKFRNRLWFLALVPSNFTPYEQALSQTRKLKALSIVESLRELIQRGQQKKRTDVRMNPDPAIENNTHSLSFSSMELNAEKRLIIEKKLASPRRGPEAPAPGPITNTKESKLLNRMAAADMASILNAADPEATSILRCLGYFSDADAHKLVFEFPHGMEGPRTLRDLLNDDRDVEPRHPLNDRIRLARKIASSVLFVHSAGLVHKSIRPDNIIVFDPVGAERGEKFPRRVGLPYLVGFEHSHHAQVVSDRVSDNVWWNDIYRHPQRQGQYPDEMYSMLHDIYSLGVVLLEIAFWTPFVLLASTGAIDETQIRAGEINPNLDSVCKISRKEAGRRVMLPPTEIVKVFKETARRQLPRTMGDRYCDVVLKCLRCLDESAEGLEGTQVKDEADDGIGGLFIENILAVLEEIVI